MLLESESLAQLLVECEKAPYDVDEADWLKCVNYYFMQVNGWEYTYYQHLEEAVPPSLWFGCDGYFSNEARTNRGWVRFWQETSNGIAEPFASHVDQQIQKNPANKINL